MFLCSHPSGKKRNEEIHQSIERISKTKTKNRIGTKRHSRIIVRFAPLFDTVINSDVIFLFDFNRIHLSLLHLWELGKSRPLRIYT